MPEESLEQKEIQAVVADHFRQSGQNQFVDINTARKCGQLLLQHCNKTDERSAFMLIAIKGHEQAHYLAGVEGGLHFWKQLSSNFSSILPDGARLALLPFGFSIHLWGDNLIRKTQRLIDATRTLLHHPVLLPDTHGGSTFQVNADYHIGYLVYPQDCGKYENFTDITRCVASATWADNTTINQATRYTKDKLETLARNAKIRQRLGLAIKKQELTFVYQPQHDLIKNKTVGVEALIRWHDAELGDVSPSEFIAVAESCELILSLTELSIAKVAHYIATHQQQLPQELRFSINISQAVFNWNQFDLYSVFKKHAFLKVNSPVGNVLDIEITESSYFDPWRSSKVTATLSKLRELGVRIIIDDFGSGYGSLSLISSGAVSTIKFDRELTVELTTEASKIGFLDMLCSATRHVSLTLIAEGVETEQQKIILISKGVNIMQGHLFSYPLNGNDLIAFLKQSTETRIA